MKQKSIFERLSDFDLTEEELTQIISVEDLDSQIDIEEKANVISNELLIPGYAELIKEKNKDITKWLDSTESNTIQRQPANRTIGFKILGLVASIALVAAIILQPWEGTSLTHEEKAVELKKLALLSYESSGILSGERGESSTNVEFEEMYQLLSEEKCGEVIKNSKFREQELWTNLYCAWVNKNDIDYQRIKKLIVEKRYPNFNSIPQ